ncbi:MAG TPA: YbaK/EbsC family protein [Candidatus Saccharimonadales bacterium]|nr:YbaK/EbsC family protein [Candidatus Saccharimonadales bacterium]
MNLGKLTFTPALESPELLGKPVAEYVERARLGDGVWVSRIDADLADTAVFCERYDIGLDISANCVVVEAKRADRVWYAVCLILATDKADINGVVRRKIDARKISFASMDTAVKLTGMEYGGITPIGLPEDWPVLVDERIVEKPHVVVGSGIRGSKVLVSTKVLSSLPNVEVLALAKVG